MLLFQVYPNTTAYLSNGFGRRQITSICKDLIWMSRKWTFSLPKFSKSRNTYFVNRIYGFLPMRRRHERKWAKINLREKSQLWSPFPVGIEDVYGVYWLESWFQNPGTSLGIETYFDLSRSRRYQVKIQSDLWFFQEVLANISSCCSLS